MAKIRILAIKKVKLNAAGFKHVLLPETGFHVVVNPEKALASLLEEPKARKQADEAARLAYKKFLMQTAKRLQKFDKLFAGMLAKGAAPATIEKQALGLKQALEKETPKWEKAAERDVTDLLKKLAKKKR